MQVPAKLLLQTGYLGQTRIEFLAEGRRLTASSAPGYHWEMQRLSLEMSFHSHSTTRESVPLGWASTEDALWGDMSNVACETSHMKDFGGVGLVDRNHLKPSPFESVVPMQHSSIRGVGPSVA